MVENPMDGNDQHVYHHREDPICTVGVEFSRTTRGDTFTIKISNATSKEQLEQKLSEARLTLDAHIAELPAT